MQEVLKKDLTYTYSYADLEKKRTKQITKWMWIVLIGCLLFQMFPYCVAINLNNVFVGSDWSVWLNFDATYTSITFTVGSIGAAVAGPFIAKIFGKQQISMRFVYIFGIAVAMLGFIAFGLNAAIAKSNQGVPPLGASITILYVFTLISQIGVMIFSGLGVNNLISKWWPAEKRGFALGIAFAGGSLGNIWMQQLVGVLSRAFGNVLTPMKDGGGNLNHGHVYYDFDGNQWATYLILGAMGLIVGCFVAFIICRKPLPSISVLDEKKLNTAATKVRQQVQEVTPLDMKKYPLYWTLAIGYLILQMGTVHASMNGLIIQNSTAYVNDLNYTDIMATGGTIFGVSCLIGNIGGGIVNDKAGPAKSIFMAGMVQCIAIICLMMSIKTPGLVYAYFVLEGISVYLYTSTPAFICGRLFGAGQSNNHMAILGIFIALGFAITNSISGAMVGDVSEKNLHDMLGYQTKGDVFSLVLFSLITMAVGTIIVVICCAIMQGKGIKGLLEYSPTKYTRVMMKHNPAIKFGAMKILLRKKDYRNNPKYLAKIKSKQKKDFYYNVYADFQKVMSLELKSSKLSSQQLTILGRIYFYKIINLKMLIDFMNVNETNNTVESDVKQLVKKDLLKEINLGKLYTFYSLSDKLASKLSAKTSSLLAKVPLISKEMENLDNIIAKLDQKQEIKMGKLAAKLEQANAIQIDEQKQHSIDSKVDVKLEKLQQKKVTLLDKIANKDSWVKYQKEYEIIEKINFEAAKKNKLIDQKQAKIIAAQKKIGVSQYILNFSKDQQYEGYDMLLNYYNNKLGVCDELISERVEDKLSRKINCFNSKAQKIQNKKDKIDATLIKNY